MAAYWLLAFLLVASSASNTAGVRLSIGQGLLDELEQTYLPGLIAQLKNQTIPDVSIAKSGFLYHLDLNLTHVDIEAIDIDLETSLLQFDASKQTITLDLNNLNLTVNTDYDADVTLFGKNSGTASVTLSNAVIKVEIEVGSNGQHQATATIQSITDDLSHSKLNITSSSWLMKLLNSLGHMWPFDDINVWLVEEIIKLLRGTINGQINKLLGGLTYQAELKALGIDVGLDYHVSQLAVVQEAQDQYLEIAVNGTCYDAAHPDQQPNVTPPVELPDWMTSNDVRAQIQSYTLDTIFWVLATNDVLEFNITQSMLPANLPIKLDTTQFSLLIPQLSQHYGLEKQMQLNVHNPTPPVISNSNSTIQIMLAPDIDFLVETADGMDRAFTLNTDLELGIAAGFTSNTTGLYILPTIDTTDTKFTKFDDSNSVIGDLDLNQVEVGFNEILTLIGRFVDDFIDARGGVYINLPSWLQLKDLDIKTETGILEIDATPIPQLIADFLNN